MTLRDYLDQLDRLALPSPCVAHKPGRTRLGERICVRCGDPLPSTR